MAMQSLAMQDRIVVVTRAGNGIGRSVALLLGAQDARVEVSDLALNGSSEGADAGPAQQDVNEITSASGMAAADTDSVATPEWWPGGQLRSCSLRGSQTRHRSAVQVGRAGHGTLSRAFQLYCASCVEQSDWHFA